MCGTATNNPILINLGDGLAHSATLLNKPDGLVRHFTLVNQAYFSPAYVDTFLITIKQLMQPTVYPYGSYWYRADCLAISSAATYLLAPYPCELSLPVLCQYDYTHFVA